MEMRSQQRSFLRGAVSRAIFIECFGVILFCPAAILAETQKLADTQSKPNILVILTDDMGYGDVSCYGSTQVSTPHIDSLASSGVRCTQGYVTGAVCAPSRAGLMTGRYQNRFGYEHNLTYPKYLEKKWVGIPKAEVTIADRLKKGGYRTACIGKWHLGQNEKWMLPNARGFDYFFGMRNGNHNYFPTLKKNHLYRNDEPITKIDVPYLTDWFTKETIDFIEAGPSDKPWFVYLAYNTPHTPLQAKEEHLKRFAHIPNKKRRTYLAMQACLDENVGRLIAYLKKSNAWDNTLIVFLNDNGGPCDANKSINAPLRGQKATLLEGGIRVPFIFSWPGKLPAGKTCDTPLMALDLLPTFLSAANLPPLKSTDGKEATGKKRKKKKKKSGRKYDGVDLLPLLRGENVAPPHRTMYWRMILRGAAIRDGDWKLLRLPHRPPELYDLAKDVSEEHNLAQQNPKTVQELMSKLHDWEMSFKSNPLWISEPRWAKHNRALYDRKYILSQPE